MRLSITTLFLFFCLLGFSQTDRTTELEEIILKGNFSKSINIGHTVESISDSILRSSYESLGNLLQNNSNLYFKQNGNGMVSSISLRGTGASRTAVYWNGIPINSNLNGQTDFNTLFANGFDQVRIRKGGGSVLLGNGAIGGAINLSDQIIFIPLKDLEVLVGLGSYSTLNGQATAKLSSKKFYGKISFGGYKSKNDYPYLGTNQKNENGELQNFNLNGVFGVKLGSKNTLNFYSTFFDSDRNSSGTITSSSQAKLLDKNSRFLLDWKFLADRFTSSTKASYLLENNTYFYDKNQIEYSESTSKRFIGKYDFTYFLNNSISFNAGAQYDNIEGFGTNIKNTTQNDFTSYFLFQHKPKSTIYYNLSVRKGFSSAYEIPLIYGLDVKFSLPKNISLRGSYATNYRLPTFNDLYWEPGGNANLIPETSKTAELGISYYTSLLSLNATSFFIQNKNLIQWQPITSDVWAPINIQSAKNFGLEISAIFNKTINKHVLNLKVQYDFVKAMDENLDKQLIYVPNHKANVILTYQIAKWNFGYNYQYTSKVYTTTSNSQTLDGYNLSNLFFKRQLFKDKIIVALNLNNIFNESYQSVAYRPMPNRNITLNIKLLI